MNENEKINKLETPPIQQARIIENFEINKSNCFISNAQIKFMRKSKWKNINFF